jgi:hypothetical protein
VVALCCCAGPTSYRCAVTEMSQHGQKAPPPSLPAVRFRDGRMSVVTPPHLGQDRYLLTGQHLRSWLHSGALPNYSFGCWRRGRGGHSQMQGGEGTC